MNHLGVVKFCGSNYVYKYKYMYTKQYICICIYIYGFSKYIDSILGVNSFLFRAGGREYIACLLMLQEIHKHQFVRVHWNLFGAVERVHAECYVFMFKFVCI